MGDNGFLPGRLLYLRSEWDNPNINDLQDSYGQQWVGVAFGGHGLWVGMVCWVGVVCAVISSEWNEKSNVHTYIVLLCSGNTVV